MTRKPVKKPKTTLTFTGILLGVGAFAGLALAMSLVYYLAEIFFNK